METLGVVLFIVAALATFAGILLLQIFLSKRDSRWLGLILPVISFLLSFLFPMNMVSLGDAGQSALMFVLVLLLGNIPTVILLAIYAACREGRRKKAQLEKMKLQDLQ